MFARFLTPAAGPAHSFIAVETLHTHRSHLLATLALASLGLVAATAARCDDVFFNWAIGVGGIDFDEGNAIAVDIAGNVFITGYFRDIVDFDPGPGAFNLSSAGGHDIFVSKLDSSGNFLWARRMGGADRNLAYGIAVDTAGNVYTTGEFYGIVDFDPGPDVFTLTSVANQDIFVSKLDSDGNFIWAKSMGGGGSGIAHAIALDTEDNVYTTGSFGSTVDFDPGPGVFTLTSAGNWDIFVSKLDSDGNFIWAKRMGGAGDDLAFGISLGAAGDVCTTGNFRDTADFDPGPAVFNVTSTGAYDIFVSKLNSQGNFLWARGFGGTEDDYGLAVAVDSTGSVYTTGSFRLRVDFDPGLALFSLTSVGLNDIFVSKLDYNGAFQWATAIGGDQDRDRGCAITTDAADRVYVTGTFVGEVDFVPGPETYSLTGAIGNGDIFISTFDSSGNFDWANVVGGRDDKASAIAVDASGSVYATGYFWGATQYDPGFDLRTAGRKDIFVMKLSPVSAEGEGGADGEGAIEGEGSAEGLVDENEGTNEGVVEGSLEGEGEGIDEGAGGGEGGVEGQLDGEGVGEGAGDEEGEIEISFSGDLNGDGRLELHEVLRLIQLFNGELYGCSANSHEDGYGVGGGVTPCNAGSCLRHNLDYLDPSCHIGLSELLRGIQFFNLTNCQDCPTLVLDASAEAGFSVAL